jgi:23S rRNA (cytidine1920-2'-O)/16S rRNA (cytidine1409-2'-O)-methyltransferase
MTNPDNAERLDLALVTRGLAESRTRAARLIEAGSVRVNDRIQTKPGHKVGTGAVLTVTALDRWVARSANKLLGACERFDIDFQGRTVLDVGASTGGFTEVALARGASTVVALDVGHGQLHPALREHHRVVVREGINARELTAEIVEEFGVGSVDDVVMDVSFISIKHIIPALVESLGREFRFVFLVKPQFEVGKGNLRDGIVRDDAKRDAALLAVSEAIVAAGLPISGVMASPIEGEHGNREAIVYGNPEAPLDAREWRHQVSTVWGG